MLQEELLENIKKQTIENLPSASNECLLDLLQNYTVASHQPTTYQHQINEIDCAYDMCDAIKKEILRRMQSYNY